MAWFAELPAQGLLAQLFVSRSKSSGQLRLLASAFRLQDPADPEERPRFAVEQLEYAPEGRIVLSTQLAAPELEQWSSAVADFRVALDLDTGLEHLYVAFWELTAAGGRQLVLGWLDLAQCRLVRLLETPADPVPPTVSAASPPAQVASASSQPMGLSADSESASGPSDRDRARLADGPSLVWLQAPGDLQVLLWHGGRWLRGQLKLPAANDGSCRLLHVAVGYPDWQTGDSGQQQQQDEDLPQEGVPLLRVLLGDPQVEAAAAADSGLNAALAWPAGHTLRVQPTGIRAALDLPEELRLLDSEVRCCEVLGATAETGLPEGWLLGCEDGSVLALDPQSTQAGQPVVLAAKLPGAVRGLMLLQDDPHPPLHPPQLQSQRGLGESPGLLDRPWIFAPEHEDDRVPLLGDRWVAELLGSTPAPPLPSAPIAQLRRLALALLVDGRVFALVQLTGAAGWTLLPTALFEGVAELLLGSFRPPRGELNWNELLLAGGSEGHRAGVQPGFPDAGLLLLSERTRRALELAGRRWDGVVEPLCLPTTTTRPSPNPSPLSGAADDHACLDNSFGWLDSCYTRFAEAVLTQQRQQRPLLHVSMTDDGERSAAGREIEQQGEARKDDEMDMEEADDLELLPLPKNPLQQRQALAGLREMLRALQQRLALARGGLLRRHSELAFKRVLVQRAVHLLALAGLPAELRPAAGPGFRDGLVPLLEDLAQLPPEQALAQLQLAEFPVAFPSPSSASSSLSSSSASSPEDAAPAAPVELRFRLLGYRFQPSPPAPCGYPLHASPAISVSAPAVSSPSSDCVMLGVWILRARLENRSTDRRLERLRLLAYVPGSAGDESAGGGSLAGCVSGVLPSLDPGERGCLQLQFQWHGCPTAIQPALFRRVRVCLAAELRMNADTDDSAPVLLELQTLRLPTRPLAEHVELESASDDDGGDVHGDNGNGGGAVKDAVADAAVDLLLTSTGGAPLRLLELLPELQPPPEPQPSRQQQQRRDLGGWVGRALGDAVGDPERGGDFLLQRAAQPFGSPRLWLECSVQRLSGAQVRLSLRGRGDDGLLAVQELLLRLGHRRPSHVRLEPFVAADSPVVRGARALLQAYREELQLLLQFARQFRPVLPGQPSEDHKEDPAGEDSADQGAAKRPRLADLDPAPPQESPFRAQQVVTVDQGAENAASVGDYFRFTDQLLRAQIRTDLLAHGLQRCLD